MSQIRIESDGTAQGTHIFDADGKEIVGWSKITWDVRQRGAAKCWLEFDAVRAEATGVQTMKGKQP